MNGSVIAALAAAALIMVYLAWKKRSSATKPENRGTPPELPSHAPDQAAVGEGAVAEESPNTAMSGLPEVPVTEPGSPIPAEAGEVATPTAAVPESTLAVAASPVTGADSAATPKSAGLEPPAAAPELPPEEPTAAAPVTAIKEVVPEHGENAPGPEPVEIDSSRQEGPAVATSVESMVTAPEPGPDSGAVTADALAAAAPLSTEEPEEASGVDQMAAGSKALDHAPPAMTAPALPPVREPASGPEAVGPERKASDHLVREMLAEPAVTDSRPMVHLTLEAYCEQLNALEEGQRGRLAEAIAQGDDGLRDRLQRELVLLNDRLALIADSYVEELACYQQVLELLSQLRNEQGEVPGLQQAMDEVQQGKTGAAEALLTQLSAQPTPFAVRAAFGSGRLAECRGDLQHALALYRQAVTQEPENTTYLQAAGRIARHLYHYTEALSWLESLVELTRKHGRTDPLPLALAQRELAYAYVLSGQYHKAGPLYKEAMTALAKKLGQDHPEMAISWQQIGELQETLGEYDKAMSLYQKALHILEQKRGPEHPALASILARLAALCMELELEKEAVPLFERLVRIREKALRPTHPQMAVALNNLAEAYRLQGRYAEAEACYQKILTIHETTHGPEHPSVAAVLQELAKLATNQRKPEEAQRYQERASVIFQKSVEAAEQQSGKQALTLEL